jgi:integrase
MKINSIIDLRNQAMLAMLFIGALRIDCLASLKVGSFNPRDASVDLNPKKGIRTKFSKKFKTFLFPFSSDLMIIVANWHKLLIESSYGLNDPLFPKAKQEILGCSFIESTEITKEHLCSSRMRAIIKSVFQKTALPYYKPHSFRHACIARAMDLAEDAQDIKAISQNIGHESIFHVMTRYAQLPEKTLKAIIQNLGGKP